MIKESGLTDTMAGSLDVRALYPSLDQVAASEGVARFVRESKTRIVGIDWREVQTYLASNMDPHVLKAEKVLHLVPPRTFVMGKRPGHTTRELSQRSQNTRDPDSKPKSSLWAPTDPDNELSDEDKRLLLSLVCKVATMQIFKHHTYSFGGVTRRQAKGGPIGLRLTSMVARIIMDQWFIGFIVAVMEAGLKVHAVIKYVDDVNVVVSMLPLGTRWSSGSFKTTQEWTLEDVKAGRSQQDVTIEAIRRGCRLHHGMPDLHLGHTRASWLENGPNARHTSLGPSRRGWTRTRRTVMDVLRETIGLGQGPEGRVRLLVALKAGDDGTGGLPTHEEHDQAGHVEGQGRVPGKVCPQAAQERAMYKRPSQGSWSQDWGATTGA